VVVGLSVAVVAADAMAWSYGSWGSSGSYGSYGSSASYGSYGRVGIIGRIQARRAARWASHGSYGSYGSSASYGSYGSSASYGSYGSSASYGSVSYVTGSSETVAAAATGDASIKVSLPADAKVFVNDAPTTSTGAERSYVSHGLRDGLTYSYAIRVQYDKDGKPVTEDKTVQLTAGKSVSLTFGQENTEAISAAQPTPEVKTEVKVEVPADAKVFLSGLPTNQSGTSRTYTTTRLAQDQQWQDYTIRVEVERDGQTLVREKSLTVTGGDSHELAFDFDSPAPAQIAQMVR
jgi:uncharacterized protein (TIGR03000 family)